MLSQIFQFTKELNNELCKNDLHESIYFNDNCGNNKDKQEWQ